MLGDLPVYRPQRLARACGAIDYACGIVIDYYLGAMVTAQMDLTGGVGSRATGEAFGDHCELPCLRNHGESRVA